MGIPLPVTWTELDAEAKRERVLDAAGELFSREGLGAPMPAVAAAAGVGVGSLYRHFADRDDLAGALVLRRLAEVRELVEASPVTADAWADLTAMLWGIIDSSGGCDDLTAEAIALTSERPDVIEA